MSHTEDGAEHVARHAVVNLNTPMLAELPSGGRDSLVRMLVELSTSGSDPAAKTERLAAHFEQLGAPQPPTVVGRLIEKIQDVEDITVVTDEGQVLHGDPNWSASEPAPEDRQDSPRP